MSAVHEVTTVMMIGGFVLVSIVLGGWSSAVSAPEDLSDLIIVDHSTRVTVPAQDRREGLERHFGQGKMQFLSAGVVIITMHGQERKGYLFACGGIGAPSFLHYEDFEEPGRTQCEELDPARPKPKK